MEKKLPTKMIDWDSVEPLFRQGHLSNYEIAAQYAADHRNSQTWKATVTESAIRARAKSKGWEKNLAGKIQERIKEKVLRGPLRTSQKENGLSDHDIIERASDVGSNVVLRHQKEIKDLIKHENRLLLELETAKKLFITQFKGGIVSKEVDMTVKEKSSTLKDLAAVRAQRIALERQAHNLDDKSTSDDVDGITVEFIGAGH